jgi:exodeoxyribonuclease VII small subunit
MAELEAIVKRLEGGQAKLEEAMDSYARGTALRAHCERKLAEAEARVQALVPGAGGPTLRDVE